MHKLFTMVAIMALGFVTLEAGGTVAGTRVSNSASLSYSVGGAVQPTVSTAAAATFIVDKKIDFSIVHDDTDKHKITTPGATAVQRTFTLENTSNTAQDFTITAINLTGSEIYDGKTDNSDVSNIQISIDGGSSWGTGVVSVSALAMDGTKTILIKSDIPSTNIDGNVMNLQIEAIAVQSNTTTAEVVTGAGTDGTVSADRKDTEDVVLAEGAGVSTFNNIQFDGKYSAWAGYMINSPVLSLTKSSCIYEDLVSGVSANAKRIPGATITYLFDISNTGSINASDINITDILPNELDASTVAFAMTNDSQGSCDCVNGVAGAGTSITPVISTQTIGLNNLTATSGQHNCVTLRVNIK